MNLNRTIIIPNDDRSLAQRLFNSAVYDEETSILRIDNAFIYAGEAEIE